VTAARKRGRPTRKRARPRPRANNSPASTAVPEVLARATGYRKLQEVARELGLERRMKALKRHLAAQPFVRVLGSQWFVDRAAFDVWWEAQRPRRRTAGE
jgi:hypothetical protein